MIERFLAQTTFTSEEDFKEHLKFKTKEDFNFAYDVMDAWAEEAPDKLALLWTSERGEEKRFTFAQLKEQTDQAASYLQSLGIGRGDMVMLILKRHYQWWLAMLALSKIGAVAIPATHMLTAHDIVYRNNRASIKAIVCVNDDYVTAQVHASLAESPTVEVLVAVNSDTELGKPCPQTSTAGTKSGTRRLPLCAQSMSTPTTTRYSSTLPAAPAASPRWWPTTTFTP